MIVGAGLSGISMAAHMQMHCPDRSFTILERRSRIGGTWDLFRYPGVRSDSDMHTLGFRFEPWKHEDAIADGPAILDYLDTTVNRRGIAPHIRYDTHVLSADWQDERALWHVTARDAAGAQFTTSARWLYLASGYYDYDDPHDAHLPGIDGFGGRVVHPQFWPQDLDYAGKRVLVIGSGATAVTIVPAMAANAAHVTMLQRTPTWMAAGPRQDKWAKRMERWLPESLAYWLTRQKNIALRSYIFRLSRRKPAKLAGRLRAWLRRDLDQAYDPRHFEPPYNPWEQRMCLVPDGDLFEALKSGSARIETGHIASFDEAGVMLKDGMHIPADIVVTATGLKLVIGGKIAITSGGEPVDFTEHFFYRGCMFSNLPNLSVVFGYLNASWTLRADNNAEYICGVLNEMARRGADVAVPALTREDEPEAVAPFDYSSGYLQRALPLMPKNAAELPWRLNHDYFADRRDFRQRPVADGVMVFRKSANSRQEAA